MIKNNDNNQKYKNLEDKILFYTKRLMFTVDDNFQKALIDEFDDLLLQFEMIEHLTKNCPRTYKEHDLSFCDEFSLDMQLREDVEEKSPPTIHNILRNNKNFNYQNNYFVIPKIVTK